MEFSLRYNRENLKLAFQTAAKLGIPALLDPEDSKQECPCEDMKGCCECLEGAINKNDFLKKGVLDEAFLTRLDVEKCNEQWAVPSSSFRSVTRQA